MRSRRSSPTRAGIERAKTTSGQKFDLPAQENASESRGPNRDKQDDAGKRKKPTLDDFTHQMMKGERDRCDNALP